MAPRFISIKDKGLRAHIESQGTDWDKFVWLVERELPNTSIAKALGKDVRTIAKWKQQYKESV